MTGWQPILDGPLLARARAALRRVADRLMVDDRVVARGRDESPKRAALLVGLPGQAIAHAYLAHADIGDGHGERAEALLERGLAEVGELRDAGMVRGYVGPAFALEHLAGDPDDPDDPNAHVDESLAREVAEAELPLVYMSGLAGRAVYARERGPRASAIAVHRAIAQLMIDRAKRDADGPYWVTSLHDDGSPRRCDLRLAWGALGVVGTLASCSGHPDARAMARAGMEWIWAQRRAPPETMFPLPTGGGTGWCVGELAVGAVLLQASRSIEDTRGQDRWLEVLRANAGRAPEAEDNAFWCHGAAGIAHMFARGYHYTGEPVLREAGARWYAFLCDLVEREGETYPPALLDGLSGIALVLAAAVTDVDPAWDRLFLLS